MAGYTPSLELVQRLRAGNSVAIGRLISRAEAGLEEARPALAALYRHAGRAHLVGITGVPGSGKSTLVAKLAARIRASNRTVAVIAIDPSSPFSGGSILGDRIRMTDLVMDPGVFIRSMATRGSMGGLAKSTLEAADILDAFGFDLIIIETVGVGQDEVEIAQASHTTVVVNAPGLGDDIQAIKAGILEIADIHVVSKADRPDANRTVTDLKGSLMLAAATTEAPPWQVPVVATSAYTGEGLETLLAEIDHHRDVQHATSLGAERRRRIAEHRVLRTAEDLVRRRFGAARDTRFAALVTETARRERDPYSAAEAVLSGG